MELDRNLERKVVFPREDNKGCEEDRDYLLGMN
jgi:hypothetical protein